MKDNEQNAHAKDYCTLLLGDNISHGVGYCLLFRIGVPEPRAHNDNIAHAFLWYIFYPNAYENDSFF